MLRLGPAFIHDMRIMARQVRLVKPAILPFIYANYALRCQIRPRIARMKRIEGGIRRVQTQSAACPMRRHRRHPRFAFFVPRFDEKGVAMRRHGFLIDMDGVIYRERQLIPGAERFISSLLDRRIPFAFLTNNGQRTRREVAMRRQPLSAASAHAGRLLARRHPEPTLVALLGRLQRLDAG